MSPSSPSSSPSTSTTPPSKKVFRLHGVNVLNRTNVDSAARQTALERRRAAHILDERQRRDTMNRLLAELAHLSEDSADEVQVQLELQQSIPNPDGSEKKPIVKSHSITTLRNAIAEIHRLRTQAGLKRLASYKEVLTSYRSVSPGSSQQASRKNAHPESSVDLYTSAPVPSAPSPYNYSHHYNHHHHHHHQIPTNSDPHLHTPPHSPPNYIQHEYHHASPPLSLPSLFSTPESLNYQRPPYSLPQRSILHHRQHQPHQRMYLPSRGLSSSPSASSSSSYSPVMSSPSTSQSYPSHNHHHHPETHTSSRPYYPSL